MSAPDRRIDIGVCTFRRRSLEDTLLSLGALEVPPGLRIRVVVADNDDKPSARTCVERVRAAIAHEVVYLHAPARNISIARNACLECGDADLLAFIDDDETATPGWLAALVARLDETGADIVLGPVRAVYHSDAPGWMRRGDFHSTRPVWVGGKIRSGYTCNVLLRRSAPGIVGRRFELSRGQSGGEDTSFFSQAWRAGATIEYAADAIVEEVVPRDRATLEWLARRRFRMGQTHGRLLAERTSAAGRAAQLALACGKAAFCVLATLSSAPFPVARNRNLLRGTLHAGALAALLGMRELKQYGAGVPEAEARA